MKKIESLKLEITQNEEFALFIDCDKKKKSLGKKNKELREVIMYLETNPNELFIKSEIVRVNKVIQAKLDGFDYWSKNICDKSVEVNKRKSIFNSQMGLTGLRRQLKQLKFIYNE